MKEDKSKEVSENTPESLAVAHKDLSKLPPLVYTDENIAELTSQRGDDIKEILDIDEIFCFTHKRKGKWLVGYFKRVDDITTLDKYSFEVSTSVVNANWTLTKSLMVYGDKELLTEKVYTSSGLFTLAQNLITSYTSELNVF